MATVSWIVNGVEYDLSSLFDYRGHDGLGMAPAHRLSNRGPQQHGETDVGYRLDPRVFRLFFGLDGETIADLYDQRDSILRLFRPLNDAGILKVALDNGETRQLEAHYVGDLGMPTARKRGYYQDCVVMLRGADPTFYDPSEVTVVFGLGVTSTGLEVPTPVPTPVGASTLDQTKTIAYAGSADTYPIVKIVGPITDCVIENDLTGEKLDFTGATINAGDYYEVDTRYGVKTVLDSSGNRQLADLVQDESDLSTFHLAAPFGTESVRNNDISVSGSGVTTATEVYFRYKVRYIGI